MKPNWSDILDYARDKLSTGSEPPWSWYEHMKLIDAVTQIMKGESSVKLYDPKEEKPTEVNLPI